MTALAIGGLPRQDRMARIDTAIRASTAGAVLVNAAVAAYISYWHAYAVVRAHGGTGITARLEPATIDGLVYASSMVILYAARHRHRVPGLARWFLAAGILATLAANMAQGLSSGPVGGVIAAWPAVSLVGSYELLVWIIRTAAAGDMDRGPAAARSGPGADQRGPTARLGAAQGPDAGPGPLISHNSVPAPTGTHGSLPADPPAGADQASGPGWYGADHADQAADQAADQPSVQSHQAAAPGTDGSINAAAVAAYRASVEDGKPISQRKLAEMFGKTSRRWARSRMTEARQSLVPA